jgi:nucleoside phosphorylase
VNSLVLLTALDLEYQAVRRHLEMTRIRSHPAGTLFEVGQLPNVAGSVALAVTGEGNVGAAVLAERAIAMFRPCALLCVGVAGGLKDDIALGDVLVATKIYAFHGGSEHNDGFLARPKAWPASHELEQLARYVARSGNWTGLLPSDPADSAGRRPAVHFKPVASGEVVLTATDTSLTVRLRGTYNDAAAVEMESAGIAQAAHMNRALPMLSVRGISDRADAGKYAADAAGWQHTAAARAAAFAISISALALSQHMPTGGTARADRTLELVTGR